MLWLPLVVGAVVGGVATLIVGARRPGHQWRRPRSPGEFFGRTKWLMLLIGLAALAWLVFRLVAGT